MVEAAGSKFKLHNTGKLPNAATKEALSSDWASFQTITSRQHRTVFFAAPAVSQKQRQEQSSLSPCCMSEKCCHEVYLPAMQMSFLDS